MRAAIYCRVSTKRQKEEGASLFTQQEQCLAYAKQHSLEVPEQFIFTEDWTGATLDRPQLESVRSLVRAREIQALIVYSTDRLSRNPIHIAIIAEECDKNKVALNFIQEPLDTSPEGQLILYVKGYAGQIERAKFADRSLRGKRMRARLGKIPGGAGINLYGYSYLPGKESGQGVRVINEEQAEVVRIIYRWLIEEKMTLYGISIKLTEQGIPSPQGTNRWGTSTVSRLLRNVAYTGKTYAFRYQAVEPKQQGEGKKRYPKTSRQERPAEEWVEIAGVTSPIISEDTFKLAQEQLRANLEKSPRSQKYQYLLRGHIRCGICDRRYDGYTNGAGYQHYRCSGKRRTVSIIPCAAKSLRALDLESKVWEKVKEILKDPEIILRELQRRNEQMGDKGLSQEEQRLLDRRIERLDKSIQRLVTLYHLGEIDDQHIISENRKLKEAKARLLQEKEALQKRLEAQTATEYQIEALKQYCEAVSANIEDFGFAEKRLALEALNLTLIVGLDSIKIQGTIPTEVSTTSTLSISSDYLILQSRRPGRGFARLSGTRDVTSP
jgi:site-specific DNA recombinase